MRDPRESALNELRRCCAEAADLHAKAAAAATDPEVRALFESLARKRTEQTEALDARVAARGALPRDVDPDAEAFQQLVAAVRRWLSADENEALLAERERTERSVLDAAQQALRVDLTDESRRLVERIHQQVAATGAQLADARRRLG